EAHADARLLAERQRIFGKRIVLRSDRLRRIHDAPLHLLRRGRHELELRTELPGPGHVVCGLFDQVLDHPQDEVARRRHRLRLVWLAHVTLLYAVTGGDAVASLLVPRARRRRVAPLRFRGGVGVSASPASPSITCITASGTV